MNVRMALPLVVAALLVLSGCGGDDDAATGSTAAGAAATEAADDGEKVTLANSASGIVPAGKLQGPEIVVEPPEGPPPKELIVKDLRKGGGEEARTGDKVTIQFTAIFLSGEIMESSWEFGSPFKFELGADKVSPGWEEGIPGMRVGGQRELIVPWTMVSQFSPLPEHTPEDAQIYVVDLLDVS